jgi:glyoxylase-like metal-dependent hydrolase (beta-lactamase superfamily II)
MASGITVRALLLSSFALDGGAMHGIVPRTLWERVHPADAKHRIALVARGLVVDHAPSGERTLIELGMGQRWSEKERAIYALAPGPDVPELLASEGVDPETITRVVLTHLHWDHAGGLARASGDTATLAFPRAEHVVGEACLAHALEAAGLSAEGSSAGAGKDAGSFRADDLALLLREGRVRRWRPGEPLAPGMEGRLSQGHSEGLIIPLIRERDDGPPLAVPTDLVPTRSHLKPTWVMAYDTLPAVSVSEKRALIAELSRIGGGVLLYHDPKVEAAWASEGGEELVPGTLDGRRWTA